jgi:hypothetical protein
MPTLLSIEAACSELGDISGGKLRTLIRSGQLDARRLGRRCLVTSESIAAFAASLESARPVSAQPKQPPLPFATH